MHPKWAEAGPCLTIPSCADICIHKQPLTVQKNLTNTLTQISPQRNVTAAVQNSEAQLDTYNKQTSLSTGEAERCQTGLNLLPCVPGRREPPHTACPNPEPGSLVH